jgi:hypothetical protein
MDTQISNLPAENEVQVYRSDFYSGLALLLRKIFTL